MYGTPIFGIWVAVGVMLLFAYVQQGLDTESQGRCMGCGATRSQDHLPNCQWREKC